MQDDDFRAIAHDVANLAALQTIKHGEGDLLLMTWLLRDRAPGVYERGIPRVCS